MVRGIQKPEGAFDSYFDFYGVVGAAGHLLEIQRLCGAVYLASLDRHLLNGIRHYKGEGPAPKGRIAPHRRRLDFRLEPKMKADLGKSAASLFPKMQQANKREAKDAARMGALVLVHSALDQLFLSLIYHRVRKDPLAYTSALQEVSKNTVSLADCLAQSRRAIGRDQVNRWLREVDRKSPLVKYDFLARVLPNKVCRWKHNGFVTYLRDLHEARNDVVHVSRTKFRWLDYEWLTEEVVDFGMFLSLDAAFPPFHDLPDEMEALAAQSK